MRSRLTLTTCLLLVACSKPTTADSRTRELEPRKVKTARAELLALPRHVQVSGTLAADEQAEIGFEVPGRTLEVLVDLGSRVEKGAVVARLAATDYELKVQQAQAAMQQARARLGLPLESESDQIDFEKAAVVAQARAVREETKAMRARVAELVTQNLKPGSELDTAEAAFRVAEARYQDALEDVRQRQAQLAQRRVELAMARKQLADTTLVAPFTGAVRERHLSPGQFVSAGVSVLTLVKTDPLRLRLMVPERAALGIRLGQTVTLTLEGDTQTYTGKIARLAPAIGEQNRTLLVEAHVPNEAGLLRPGAFARASILVSEDERAVCIPEAALLTFAGIESVVLVSDGKAKEQRVRTGRRAGGQIEILEGLAADALLAVPPQGLATGQPLILE